MTTREMECCISLHIQQHSTSFLLTSNAGLGRLEQYPFSTVQIDPSLKPFALSMRVDRHHPFPSRCVLCIQMRMS